MIYSRAGCEEIFKKISTELNIDHCEITWWYDVRHDAQGLRVSDAARDCLLEYGIEHYDFSIHGDLVRKPRVLLDLDRKISCPYYLGTKKPWQLMLLGSQDAVMLSLYNDIERFLQNTVPKSGR